MHCSTSLPNAIRVLFLSLLITILNACGGGSGGGGSPAPTPSVSMANVLGTWQYTSSKPAGTNTPVDMSTTGITLRIVATGFNFTVPATITVGGITYAPCFESDTWTLSGNTFTSQVVASPMPGSMCAAVGTTATKTVSVSGNTLTTTDAAGTTDVFTRVPGTGSGSSYTVGGILSGLTTGSSITLANTANTNVPLTLSANGSFSFGTQTDGSTYGISVQTVPASLNCAMTYNSGTVHGASAVADVICGPLPRAGTGTSSAVVNLAAGNEALAATLLPNGKVLFTGGFNGVTYLASAELFDPATNIVTAAASMAAARGYHTATLLANGKVLVVGGFNGTVGLSSAELYDPIGNTWAPAGVMTSTRNRHTATLLPNGKVLVTGGIPAGSVATPLASAEVYDPTTNTWTPAGTMLTARMDHTATPLPDGTVLVAGGWSGATYTAGAEIYDYNSNAWFTVGTMAAARGGHTATMLPNGKVLVAAGSGTIATLNSAELYDPATCTWSATGSLASARYLPSATLLPSGKVLFAAGAPSTALTTPYVTTELYDPVAGTFSAGGNLAAARTRHAALLAQGVVVLAGGWDGAARLASIEAYY